MKHVTDKDMGLQKFMRELQKANNAEVVIGIQEGSNNGEGQSIAEYAAYNEYGGIAKHEGGTRYTKSGGKTRFVSNSFMGPVHGVTTAHDIVIPERSFMRSTFDEKTKEISADFAAKYDLMKQGKMTAFKALSLVGLKHESDIKAKISSNIAPANAASTIRKKGSSKTLIDTGAMLASVRYVVRMFKK